MPAEITSVVGGHPLVAQTLARRGIDTAYAARAFLDPDQYRPTPPTALPGLAEAVARLRLASERQEPICVWGDFDVDGQTATTVLVSTLQEIGARVTHHIPVRARESHGVNLPVLSQVIDAGAQLLLTCDTGITAHAAVSYAQTRGVDVIITDHHDLPPDLPPAYAVVNPKLLSADHPLRELPGVGCAYKVAEELLIQAGQADAAAQLLDLVALGAVADLARLTGDTRYLVQRGLTMLRQTERAGLQAILEGAELGATWLTEEHIGFELAPRLNALGRLADANMAVELLTTHDRGRARILASELEGLNAQRKLLCAQVFQAAQAQIAREPRLLDDAALVLSHPTWPAGVIGIVASRLVEIYQRPVVLIATSPGELGRGSARSVEGCNITAAIAVHSEMLETFGGHPMAAGLAIDPERISRFRRALSRTIQEMCGERGGHALTIDGYLPLTDLSLAFVADIERLAPCGPGNPPLTLVSRGVKVSKATAIGRGGEHRQVTVEDETGATQRVIWWQGADQPLPEGRFDLAYSARASDFRGQRDVQIEWIDARTAAPESIDLRPAPSAIAIIDRRTEIDTGMASQQ